MYLKKESEKIEGVMNQNLDRRGSQFFDFSDHIFTWQFQRNL